MVIGTKFIVFAGNRGSRDEAGAEQIKLIADQKELCLAMCHDLVEGARGYQKHDWAHIYDVDAKMIVARKYK